VLKFQFDRASLEEKRAQTSVLVTTQFCVSNADTKFNFNRHMDRTVRCNFSERIVGCNRALNGRDINAAELCRPPNRLCEGAVADEYEHYCEHGVCCMVVGQVTCA